MGKSKDTEPYEKKLYRSQRFLIGELEAFYMEGGNVYKSLRSLCSLLDKESINYALIGGLAVAEHNAPRTTLDIDILVSEEGLEKFRRFFIGHGYLPKFKGAKRTFRDTTTGVRIEFVTIGERAGKFTIPEVAKIEKDGIKIVGLKDLIKLKLMASVSREDRLKARQDQVDIARLIRVHRLSVNFVNEKEFGRELVKEYQKLYQDAQTNEET